MKELRDQILAIAVTKSEKDIIDVLKDKMAKQDKRKVSRADAVLFAVNSVLDEVCFPDIFAKRDG